MLSPLRTAILALSMPLLAGGRPPQAPVNINTASVTELMQLPKVGARTAERIVAYRKQHGGFKRVEELMNVKGIGEKSFAKLRSHLSVGAKPAAKP